MSEAIKPSKGEWVVDDAQPGDLYRYVACGEGNSFGYVCRISTNGNANAEDDARLIADAGNTFNTTGLTPRQLVERVKELEGVLTDALKTAKFERHADRPWHLRAKEALSKALPNTVAEVKE